MSTTSPEGDIGSASEGDNKPHLTWAGIWVTGLASVAQGLAFKLTGAGVCARVGNFFTSESTYSEDAKRGKVNRSSRHDRRNRPPMKDVFNRIGNLTVADLGKDEPLYTSLWFDAVKPTTCSTTLLKRSTASKK